MIEPATPAMLVAAFSGWNDAGESACSAAQFLVELWGLECIGAMDCEDYFDLRVNRPIIYRTSQGTRKVRFPNIEFYQGHTSSGERVMVFLGIEPSLQWRRFVDDLIAMFHSLHVVDVYLLGSYLADIPHTRELPLTCTSSSAWVQKSDRVPESHYEGPTGIVGMLELVAAQRGFHTRALSTQVPRYLRDRTCPSATLRLLRLLLAEFKETADLSQLEGEAKLWAEVATSAVAEEPRLRDYVSQLESDCDTADYFAASGEAIAADFERYLRRYREQ